MRSLIVTVIEGGFVALLLVGGLLLVSRTWSQSSSAVVVVASPTPPQFSPAEQDAIDRAKQYLREHAKEYRLRPDLSDLRAERVDLSLGVSVVTFAQSYQDIVIQDGGVKVIFGNSKPGATVLSSYKPQIVVRNATPPYPGPNAPTLAPTLSANDAATRAFTATGAKSRFRAPPAKANLVIYPIVKPGSQPVYTLVWEVRLVTTDPFGDWGVVVDAWTGEILVRDNHFVPEPTMPGQPSLAPRVTPTATPLPPTRTPTPARPVVPTATPILPLPPIPLDPSKIITVPAPTASPTPPKSSLLAPK